jgi:Flp pilus assembly protein protease CpaA
LFVLLRHLLRVTEYKDLNRMQIPNLAIVFGPTLMWPPSSLVTQNLALDMMQQNIIVETLLNNAQQIF